MKRKGWFSNRFKTKEDMERHQQSQWDVVFSCDKNNLKGLKASLEPLSAAVRRLNVNSYRITANSKRLDIFLGNNKYFKVDTGERGILPPNKSKFICDYLGLDYESNKDNFQYPLR